MKFNLDKSLEILERTPAVLEALLEGLSAEWTENNEGGETWSPYDVVGHLIHGERTDWIVRVEIILGDSVNRTFTPFDRFAQFRESKGKALKELLAEFRQLRAANLEKVRSMGLKQADFSKKANHPALGEVTLSQLLSTWTAHDLGHIGQIARVMAKQYRLEAGPWKEYLRILQD